MVSINSIEEEEQVSMGVKVEKQGDWEEQTSSSKRREFISKEVKGVIKSGQVDDMILVRNHMKRKWTKWFNKDLIKESFFREKICRLNRAIKERRAKGAL